METRELRYFVAVAEELHFGRAAERLAIAQPPLSRAIQLLERRLGVALFERTGRRVVLTAAGDVLLHEGRAALDAVRAAELRTQRAAAQPRQIVLAVKAGGSNALLMSVLEVWRRSMPDVTVDVQLAGIGEPERMLRDGRADVALLYRPYDDTAGLDTVELHTEGQVALLPEGHALSKRKRLTMADLESLPDLELPRWPEPDGTYAAGSGPAIRDYVQLLQLVALGRACALVPESAPLLDHVAVVPVLDAEQVVTVIAWPPQSRSAVVAQLVQVASTNRVGLS